MNKEFVSYEQALELKELGFDEACICYYDIEDSYKLKPTPMKEEINAFHFNSTSIMVAAPLYQQAFRWFREEHGIHIRIEKYDETKWWGNWGTWTSNVFETYEEAESACIDKLIEIVKNK